MKKLLFFLLFDLFMSAVAFASSPIVAVDTFSNFLTGLRDPAVHVDTITPSDTDDIPHVTRKIYVGGDGDINLITLDGETVLFKGLKTGTILEIRATRIKNSGTSPNMYLLGLY